MTEPIEDGGSRTAAAQRDQFPLGSPDASAAATYDADGFVAVEEAPAYALLAAEGRDLPARVVVGKMGAGKSEYLRRLRASWAREAETFVAPVDVELPSASLVREVSRLLEDRSEGWRLLWRRAITRSVVSHLLYESRLAESLPSIRLRSLKALPADLLQLGGSPHGVYAQVEDIARASRTRIELSHFLEDGRWRTIDHELELALDAGPVRVCFFLDAVEEDCASEPLYWLVCQKRLFLQALSLARSRIAEKLHVVVSIRDVAFSAALRTARAASYMFHPQVRVLEWNAVLAHRFMCRKLAALPTAFKLAPSAEDPFHAWLGRETVRNAVRGLDEPVADYVLRHSRLVPRDLVNTGNLLCRELVAASRDGARYVSDAAISRAVKEGSAWAGREQLQACANEITSVLLAHADFAARRQRSLLAEDAVGQIAEQLKGIVATCGAERISRAALETLIERGKGLFADDIDVSALLWRAGMLGYADSHNGAEVFGGGFMSLQDLSSSAAAYVFHPCVADAANLAAVGTTPIRAYAPAIIAAGRLRGEST